MEKRKIILTIILAAVLAFVVIYFVNKSSEFVMPIEQKEEVTEKLPDVKPETSVTAKPKVKAEKVKVTPKKVVKKAETVPLKPAETKVDSVQLESTVMTEEVSEPEEEGIVVPVKYSSKNVYKYVYTPARFKKK